MASTTRQVRVFRYDPTVGGDGEFQTYKLDFANESAATMLDVLLRIQREQDPTISFRFACRVAMCGSCGMVINGRERLACKTNVSDLAPGEEITLRPMNHFPVIKDLVVDMDPFFNKMRQTLNFFEPKEKSTEPAMIPPDAPERQEIRIATDCIACGCCVSSCTMVDHHADYAGPAALTRAYALIADSRDGLFDERLAESLPSCHECRTEMNCTEVCPKGISPTRAIKYIQRVALTQNGIGSKEPEAPVAGPIEFVAHGEEEQVEIADELVVARTQTTGKRTTAEVRSAEGRTAETRTAPECVLMDRATFLKGAGVALLGAGIAVTVGSIGAISTVGPSQDESKPRWVPVIKLADVPPDKVTTVLLNYEVKSGIYTQAKSTPVMVSRLGPELVCYKTTCPHLGCTVHWDGQTDQFRCACHGGTFDESGNVVAGPPPHALDRYQHKIEGGQLLVLL
jgi:succinate dehydrogenase / fumarate reductase iron-sulfur subunit